MNDDHIAVALIAGPSALAVAVVGLVGVLASRKEPRATKKLAALNTILEKFPAGEAREALEERRSRVAVAHGAQREPLGVFTVAYLFLFGGYLLAVVSLLVAGGDASVWQSLSTNLLLGLVFGGLVFVLIGVALFIVGIVFRFRDWQRGHALQSSVDLETTQIAAERPDASRVVPVRGIAASPAGAPPTR